MSRARFRALLRENSGSEIRWKTSHITGIGCELLKRSSGIRRLDCDVEWFAVEKRFRI
jgi:hypothetical protein